MISAAKKTINQWLEMDIPIEQQLPDIKNFLTRAAEFIVSGEKDWGEKNKDLPYVDDFVVVYMLGMDVFVKIFLHETGIKDEELEKYVAVPLKIKKYDWMIHEEEKIPLPIITQDILCYRVPDNMAYWWQPDGDIVLTDDFWEIFHDFKLQYQDIKKNLIKEECLDVLDSMKKLTDIGTACEEIFGRPVIFEEFFYEMISNSQSFDNQALIKLLDKYVKAYTVQYNEEKKKDMWRYSIGAGNNQSYNILKKLSAILTNKNLRYRLQEI